MRKSYTKYQTKRSTDKMTHNHTTSILHEVQSLIDHLHIKGRIDDKTTLFYGLQKLYKTPGRSLLSYCRCCFKVKQYPTQRSHLNRNPTHQRQYGTPSRKFPTSRHHKIIHRHYYNQKLFSNKSWVP